MIDHKRRQNVVRTSVTHSVTPRVPLFCSYHILTSSVIYYWTDARQLDYEKVTYPKRDCFFKFPVSIMVVRWHLAKAICSLCVTTEVWKKHFFPFKSEILFPIPTQYNVQNQKKSEEVVFNIVWGVGGEVRQVKLYSRLTCTLNDVRAHCYCAPLLHTLFIKHARATSFSSARRKLNKTKSWWPWR